MTENEKLAKGEIEWLEHKLAVARLRLEKAQKPFRARAAFFERAILAYAETHRADILKGCGRAKSRLFPSGLKVGWRKEGGEYRWRKDVTPKEAKAALLAWAKGMQPHVEGTPLTRPGPEEPILEEIKELLKFITGDTGAPAQADGLEWVPESEAITIKTGEER